jgi:hypothetical protein
VYVDLDGLEAAWHLHGRHGTQGAGAPYRT